jgi:pimeloyl-ACP methyl ester carboxylesterase
VIEKLIRQFLYYPARLRRDAPLPAYAADAREIFVTSSAGDEIHGLYWPAESGRPTLLYLHGNAQSVYEWAMVRPELAPLDCGLLLIDYPGYGKSSGKPTEDGLYAAAQAAYQWLVYDQHVAADQIVVLGKSLGGGVATELASTQPIAGLILESTFCSVVHVAKKLYPFVPAGMIFKTERFDSLDRIPTIGAPTLVVHGDCDELIPAAQGQTLFDAAGEPKSLYMVPGAGHNNVADTAGPSYGHTIREWMNTLG